ncbi:MAG: cytochrome b/b6 domain-containing protein [Hyphomicrobiaceae bacterium]
MNNNQSRQPPAGFVRVRLWDLPTRLFHWLLAICVGVGWWLGDNRSFTTIEYHFYLGYCIIGLLLFRLLWGIIGPRNVRLTALVPTPAAVLRYARTVPDRSPSGTPGHNPLGALSVSAMLLSMIVQVASGLFAEDDGLFAAGPLSVYAPGWLVLRMNSIHSFNSNILLALIALHVSAALFYLIWKRENLISAMVTGLKLVRANTSSSDRDANEDVGRV